MSQIIDLPGKTPQEKPPKERAPLINHLIALAVTIVVGLVYFYFALPAINLQNIDFYIYLLALTVTYIVVYLLLCGIIKLEMEAVDMVPALKKDCLVPVVIAALLVALLLVGILISSVVFRSRAYTQLLTVEPGDFATEVEQLSFNQIPMLDRASAQRLGDRKLGELSDMVSQFEVSDDYPQMNFNGRPVRVATLIYGDFFKWINNNRNGLPAYIVTDMVTQNVEVVRLPVGIKYSQSDLFFRKITRYLRINYPTYMFEVPRMEIDEDGKPYWIASRIVKTIGLFGGTDISGAVILDAVTGESRYYDKADIPTWVDQVFSSNIIIEQYDYYGKYQNGFINSMFGQRGVTVATEGNNFIAQYDDVYFYTGITSVGDDQSILGFILTNQRTKQTSYYPCAGAKELSAATSAEGVVQHLKYTATFPLLLNISGEPTYFMSLKDNAGLVKLYAMVNVQQYNIVATGDTVSACEDEYKILLQRHGISDVEQPLYQDAEITGVVTDVRTAVLGGESFYYLRLDGSTTYYALRAANDQRVIVLNTGDRVTLVYDRPVENIGIFPARLK